MKQSITYEQFSTMYETVDSKKRLQLRNQFPKFAAKHTLLRDPGALKIGATVFVIVRRHSRTGYSKSISLYAFAVRTDAGFQASNDNPALQALTLTYNVGKLMDYNVHNCDGRDVIRTTDYAQEFVAHLSQCLFGIDQSSALRCEVL